MFRAGLAAFAKLFADRYAADNMRMNNVLPGFIDSLPEKEEFRGRIPMGRYGRVEEVAATVAFLASDAAGYITGQNLRMDGGITSRSKPGLARRPNIGYIWRMDLLKPAQHYPTMQDPQHQPRYVGLPTFFRCPLPRRI